MQRFLAYDWPGNIRELENAVHRLSVLQDQEALLREFSAPSINARPCGNRWGSAEPAAVSFTDCDPGACSVFKQAEQAKLAQEEQAIRTALQTTYWNRKKAAGLLGVDYKALLYKMKKLGIFEPGSDHAPV